MGEGSSEEEIRVAFRQLALAVHPDKNRDPRAGEAFAKVQQVTRVSIVFLINVKLQLSEITVKINQKKKRVQIMLPRHSVDSPAKPRLQP